MFCIYQLAKVAPEPTSYYPIYFFLDCAFWFVISLTMLSLTDAKFRVKGKPNTQKRTLEENIHKRTKSTSVNSIS